MKVSDLVAVLQLLDPDHDVVIAGTDLGYGHEITVSEVHQYDNTKYVRLVPGDEYEEDEE